MNKNVKFISYDGSYPNLCSGTLTIEIKGKRFDNIRLVSGGSVWFDNKWDEHIEYGPWNISVSELDNKKDKEELELIKKYYNDIEQVINENIPQGCRGGCI